MQRQPFGHGLLIAVAVGLGGYALWRFVQAAYGTGPEGGGDSSAMGRIVALGSGIAYLAMCGLAVSILLGTSSRKSSSPHHAAAGVLGLARRRIPGRCRRRALHRDRASTRATRASPTSFSKRTRPTKWDQRATQFITGIGVVGHLARMVAFGLIGIFALKAAIDYNPNKAIGLDGALATIAQQSFGQYLLALVAAGLIAFGLYSIADARYRRI